MALLTTRILLTTHTRKHTFKRNHARTHAVEDLLMWREVPKSAGALVALTGAYLLLEWSGIPLLTLLSNAGLAATLLCLVWALVARALNM